MEINVAAARVNLPCPLVRLIDEEASEVALAQDVDGAESLHMGAEPRPAVRCVGETLDGPTGVGE